MEEILRVNKLKLSFDTYGGSIHAVRGVSFHVNQGEIMALVGESGCGKSTTAQAVLGLHSSPPAHIESGSILLCGHEVTTAGLPELEKLRGRAAGMVFQDPLTGLNPTMKVGKQITEGLFRRGELSAGDCEREAVRLLELVKIPDANIRARQYPHQFSGGMRQRAMIAMALAGKPKLLIADEPTTALDVTTQLEILKLLCHIRTETGTAILIITHDLSVAANLAHRLAVMYGGEIVEQGEVGDVFYAPRHPYTQGLLESLSFSKEGKELVSIPGTPPDLFVVPRGCGFAPRCKYGMKICQRQAPPVYGEKDGHESACWRQDPQFLERERRTGGNIS